MKTKPLISMLALSKRTDCDRKAIAQVVKAKGIAPKAMPSNGKAKGLDDGDVRLICRTLGLDYRRAIGRVNEAAAV